MRHCALYWLPNTYAVLKYKETKILKINFLTAKNST